MKTIVHMTTIKIVGVILIILSAVALFWYGNATSSQATPAIVAQVYFDGEYRIADGEWQQIVKGNHISSTEGDVTLRGKFHMLAPDGEYAGVYNGDIPIALYVDHIALTIHEGENEPVILDAENRLYGASSCGVEWVAYTFADIGEKPVEIVVHNPHNFGNETAVDELLANTAFWTGIDFEKSVLQSGETQRNIGLLFVIISLVILGTALFSTLIHIKNSKTLWVLGAVILFAGTYFSYSADGISFWSESVVSNTTILGCSMIFYMLFLSFALVHFLKTTKTIGTITVAFLGLFNGVIFVLPILTDLLFYDMWLYWVAVQMLANVILLCCLVREFFAANGKERFIYFGLILPL